MHDFSITASFGAAVSTPEAPLAPGDLFQRADAAMYRAKQGGRDRVVKDER
ncbi:diguanylate cyclase [compost metagenome]